VAPPRWRPEDAPPGDRWAAPAAPPSDDEPAIPDQPATPRVVDVVGPLDRATFLLRHAPPVPALGHVWKRIVPLRGARELQEREAHRQRTSHKRAS
jgi:hypothetical protein